jgi:hypothetical protein
MAVLDRFGGCEIQASGWKLASHMAGSVSQAIALEILKRLNRTGFVGGLLTELGGFVRCLCSRGGRWGARGYAYRGAQEEKDQGDSAYD